jgi:hypothetical protein
MAYSFLLDSGGLPQTFLDSPCLGLPKGQAVALHLLKGTA